MTKKINNIKNLHIGCGKRNIPNFINIDQVDYKHIHYKRNVRNLNFIQTNSIEYIYASHVLEYFDFEEAKKVLREWKRVLKSGGIIRLSVPNFKSLIKIYEKTNDIDKVIGPLFGKIKFKKSYAYHKCVYDYKKLYSLLKLLKFKKIKEYNLQDTFHYKFDDHSQAFYPHMNNNGIKVSINVEAKK